MENSAVPFPVRNLTDFFQFQKIVTVHHFGRKTTGRVHFHGWAIAARRCENIVNHIICRMFPISVLKILKT